MLIEESDAAPGQSIALRHYSAGGISGWTRRVDSGSVVTPHRFPLPGAVVLHRSTQGPTLLANVLSRHTALRVTQARAGERFQPGTVYLAPSDLHLSVTPA